MSGNLLFDLLTGDRFPSSGTRYFSLLRNTFDTVLTQSVQRHFYKHTLHIYLRSTPNIAGEMC